MIEIVLQDDGFGSYWWESPWGEISIEQRPTHCDRGRVVIKHTCGGAVSNLFNPLLSGAYFFDEGRAKQHVQAVVDLAQSLSDSQLRSLIPQVVGFDEFKGVDCDGVLFKGVIQSIDVDIFVFNIQVHPDKQNFDLDWADGFPRYYLDRDIAYEELKAWMQRRGQQ